MREVVARVAYGRLGARREGSWPTCADKRFVKGGKLVGKKSKDALRCLITCRIGGQLSFSLTKKARRAQTSRDSSSSPSEAWPIAVRRRNTL